MPGRKHSSKKRKTAVASTVSLIGPKEQLQAEMRSLGYVEGLFVYTIIHANIFSPATWRPALSAICGEGKGLKELDKSILVPGLMRFRQEFFAILHRKLSSSFSYDQFSS